MQFSARFSTLLPCRWAFSAYWAAPPNLHVICRLQLPVAHVVFLLTIPLIYGKLILRFMICMHKQMITQTKREVTPPTKATSRFVIVAYFATGPSSFSKRMCRHGSPGFVSQMRCQRGIGEKRPGRPAVGLPGREGLFRHPHPPVRG